MTYPAGVEPTYRAGRPGRSMRLSDATADGTHRADIGGSDQDTACAGYGPAITVGLIFAGFGRDKNNGIGAALETQKKSHRPQARAFSVHLLTASGSVPSLPLLVAASEERWTAIRHAEFGRRLAILNATRRALYPDWRVDPAVLPPRPAHRTEWRVPSAKSKRPRSAGGAEGHEGVRLKRARRSEPSAGTNTGIDGSRTSLVETDGRLLLTALKRHIRNLVARLLGTAGLGDDVEDTVAIGADLDLMAGRLTSPRTLTSDEVWFLTATGPACRLDQRRAPSRCSMIPR